RLVARDAEGAQAGIARPVAQALAARDEAVAVALDRLEDRVEGLRRDAGRVEPEERGVASPERFGDRVELEGVRGRFVGRAARGKTVPPGDQASRPFLAAE